MRFPVIYQAYLKNEETMCIGIYLPSLSIDTRYKESEEGNE